MTFGNGTLCSSAFMIVSKKNVTTFKCKLKILMQLTATTTVKFYIRLLVCEKVFR